MASFVSGSDIHPVPGVGTFSVFSVSLHMHAEGLQMQFMPEGEQRPLGGVLRFKVRILDDGIPAISYLDPARHPSDGTPLLVADDRVVAAAQILADDVIASREVFLFYNMEASIGREIHELRKARSREVGSVNVDGRPEADASDDRLSLLVDLESILADWKVRSRGELEGFRNFLSMRCDELRARTAASAPGM